MTSPKATAGADLDPIVSRNLKEYPKDVWAHLDYQLLQFLRDKPTPQLDALAPLMDWTREMAGFWESRFDALEELLVRRDSEGR